MFPDNSIGDRIRMRRASLNLSQGALAESLGVASAQLYRYESGRTKPRPQMIGKIAALLGVRPEWLSNGELPMSEDGSIPSNQQIHEVEFSVSLDTYLILKRVAQERNISTGEAIKYLLLEFKSKQSKNP